jgi:hypothetical protein
MAKSSKGASEKAAQGLKRAELGGIKGAKQLDQAERADPADVEAVEQVASDGPKGRGLAR